jgi:glucose-1-phosphate adenylyltransferase
MAGTTNKVLGMILAGGEGNRLLPLTQHRAKPAVPFGGKYRLIDFALSNFINSSVYSVYVLTQFKSQSLTEHINESWRFGSLIRDHFILPVPAQKRTGDSWYQGTADAIYQNINLIEDGDFDLIAVFGADHIYRMDLQQMIEFHVRKKADVTVSALPVPIEDAKSFGVIQVQEKFRIIGFQEKPKRPKPIPGRDKEAFASMGNYIFNKDFLINILYKDAKDKNSSHDFGKDILPKIFNTSRVYGYDFRRNRIPGISKKEIGYWRDVGTIKAFWEANMDLRSVKPDFNLYNKKWPIRTASYGTPPAKFVFNEDGRRGQAIDSIIGEGSIISGGKVLESVIGREVLVDSGAEVKSSLVMDRVKINKDCKIKMAIIDKDVEVPPGTEIGYDLKHDKKRFFVDKESGIIVVSKGYKFS